LQLNKRTLKSRIAYSPEIVWICGSQLHRQLDEVADADEAAPAVAIPACN